MGYPIDWVRMRVDGLPRGKGTHRTVPRKGKGGVAYQAKIPDPATEAWEAKLAWAARMALGRLGMIPKGVPVRCMLRARFAVPASYSARLRAQCLAGLIRPTGKPDLDNVCKAIGDGLNQVAWADDSQVTEWIVSKVYHEQPGVLLSWQAIDTARDLSRAAGQ